MSIAGNMSKDHHFLGKEYCRFDGNHKYVKGFVTLNASTYHPLLKKQVFLANMQCKHERTHTVQKFYRLLNECFKEVINTTNKY